MTDGERPTTREGAHRATIASMASLLPRAGVSKAARRAAAAGLAALAVRGGALGAATLTCGTLALTMGAPAALAAPTAKDRAEARALLTQAAKAMKEKRPADAAKALRRSNELDPQGQTQLDLARALVAAQRLVEARATLDALIAESNAPAAKKLQKAASELRAEILPRIPKLTLRVFGNLASDAKAWIDGAQVDASAPIPLDPGEHEIELKANKERATQSITLVEGEERDLTMVIGGTEPSPAASAGPSTGLVAGTVVAFTLGAAGIVVGSVFGSFAFDEANKLLALCPTSPCAASADALAARDTSLLNGDVSTATFIAGGVGLGVGAILAVVTAKSGPAPKRADAARPLVTPWMAPLQQSGATATPGLVVGVRGSF
jgi:hypothetical protein